MDASRSSFATTDGHRCRLGDNGEPHIALPMFGGRSMATLTPPETRLRTSLARRQRGFAHLDQKSTVVRIPNTSALRLVGAIYPPGQMTYWASIFRFSHPVACHPYQASRCIFVVLHVAGADAQTIGLGLSICDVGIDLRRPEGEAPSVLRPRTDALLEKPSAIW